MSSESKRSANRANAQHSTGPKTQEGKKRSRLNALRHGLNSQAVLLPHEDAIAFQHHNEKWFTDLKPKGALEQQLVQSMVDLSWRINRIRNMETNMLADAYNEIAPSVQANDPETHAALTMARAARLCEDSILKLGIHEQRASRAFERTVKQLQELQCARFEREKQEMDDAQSIHKMQKQKEIAWTPSGLGFVLTIPEIDAAIRRKALLQEAEMFHETRQPTAITATP